MSSFIDLSFAAVTGVCLIAICLVGNPATNKAIAAVLYTSLVASGLVSARHAAIQRYRRTLKWPVGFRMRTPKVRSNDYYVFVLGSGGHTKEMLMMMDDGHLDFGDTHRRYIISSGDKMSKDHVLAYETDLKAGCEAAKCRPGTYDIVTVPRARKVHQPIWTTPISALSSVMGILPALLSPPQGAAENTISVPSKVFSNGPATGFFVAATIYLLKLLFMVSSSDMNFIYIESWARVSSLSLTGRALYYTDVADLMVVQHHQVAKTYGLTCVGPMVFNARRDDS